MSETRSTPFDQTPEARIAAMGLVLPTPPKPLAAYVPFKRVGNLVYIAGQITMKDGAVSVKGSVPSQVSVEDAAKAAELCAINAVAVLKMAVGDLSKVKQIVRLGVFVCSDAGFTQQPAVANGASELMVKIFGEAGRHARAAVGSIALPLGSTVEVEVLAEVE